MNRFLFIALMLCLAEGCSKIDPEQNTDYGFHDDYEDEVFAYLKKKESCLKFILRKSRSSFFVERAFEISVDCVFSK